MQLPGPFLCLRGHLPIFNGNRECGKMDEGTLRNSRFFRVFLFPGIFLILQFAQAQQDPMYSQYLYNGLVFNPAYAGSKDALAANSFYRQQWFGISGAPTTQSLSMHLPDRSRRNGFGISLTNDNISYLGQSWIIADYAFRIPVGRGKIALGLRGTAYNYRINWENADLKNKNDQVGINYSRNIFLPNAGAGIYYYNQHMFAGASVPHILNNTLDQTNATFDINQDRTDIAILRRHYFATAGCLIPLGHFVEAKPSVLLKYVAGAPMQFDFNLQAFFHDKVGIGGSWRTGDGIVGTVSYYITGQLLFGYAYDYPFTILNGFTSGSHELMLSYVWRFEKDGIVSPRAF